VYHIRLLQAQRTFPLRNEYICRLSAESTNKTKPWKTTDRGRLIEAKHRPYQTRRRMDIMARKLLPSLQIFSFLLSRKANSPLNGNDRGKSVRIFYSFNRSSVSVESYLGRFERRRASDPVLADDASSGSLLVKNWSHKKVVHRKHNHACLFSRERFDRLAAAEV
jgi:hypothetical protein